MAKARPKEPAELTFEEAFSELQGLVESLESGDLDLEESMKRFERGQALAERCRQLLETAELRLRKIVPDSEAGYVEEELDLEGE